MLKIISALSWLLAGVLTQPSQSPAQTERVLVGKNVELVLIQDDNNLVTATDQQGGLELSQVSEKNGNAIRFFSPHGKRIRVEMHTNTLTSVKTENDALVTIMGTFAARKLEIRLGAESVLAGKVDAGELSIHAGSGSRLQLHVHGGQLSTTLAPGAKAVFAGSVINASIHTQDNAVCKAGKLSVRSVRTATEGNSVVELHPEGKILPDSEYRYGLTTRHSGCCKKSTFLAQSN